MKKVMFEPLEQQNCLDPVRWLSWAGWKFPFKFSNWWAICPNLLTLPSNFIPLHYYKERNLLCNRPNKALPHLPAAKRALLFGKEGRPSLEWLDLTPSLSHHNAWIWIVQKKRFSWEAVLHWVDCSEGKLSGGGWEKSESSWFHLMICLLLSRG